MAAQDPVRTSSRSLHADFAKDPAAWMRHNPELVARVNDVKGILYEQRLLGKCADYDSLKASRFYDDSGLWFCRINDKFRLIYTWRDLSPVEIDEVHLLGAAYDKARGPYTEDGHLRSTLPPPNGDRFHLLCADGSRVALPLVLSVAAITASDKLNTQR